MDERAPDAPKRQLLSACARGLRGRCPRCGEGRLLSGYMAPATACTACGEDFTPFQTADFAPYLVVFAIGLVFTPIMVALALSPFSSPVLSGLVLVAALAAALALLPRAKGVAIGILWALDVRTNG